MSLFKNKNLFAKKVLHIAVTSNVQNSLKEHCDAILDGGQEHGS